MNRAEIKVIELHHISFKMRSPVEQLGKRKRNQHGVNVAWMIAHTGNGENDA